MTKQDINITRLYVPDSLDIVQPKASPLTTILGPIAHVNPVLRELGFDSWDEMDQLVSEVDLSTPEKITALAEWMKDDGTKAGLLRLMETSNV